MEINEIMEFHRKNCSAKGLSRGRYHSLPSLWKFAADVDTSGRMECQRVSSQHMRHILQFLCSGSLFITPKNSYVNTFCLEQVAGRGERHTIAHKIRQLKNTRTSRKKWKWNRNTNAWYVDVGLPSHEKKNHIFPTIIQLFHSLYPTKFSLFICAITIFHQRVLPSWFHPAENRTWREKKLNHVSAEKRPLFGGLLPQRGAEKVINHLRACGFGECHSLINTASKYLTKRALH